MSTPLVSVVTPFHNTARHLAQCIESVLAQSYRNFEYLLVDNCSDDGSTEIAKSFAARDPRIRVIRRDELLSQVRNYNSALAEISPDSRYCKIVQADDAIFPECLAAMVEVFERSESIGLVSSYYLKGDRLMGSGMPFPATVVDGREMARFYLRTGIFVFGSPTTVCYRASIVRGEAPFFDETYLHEDTDKCVQILADWDFGFVHQVLSFLRVEDHSISAAARDFDPAMLDGYIITQRYASTFLPADEAALVKRKSRREYYGVLALAALKLKGAEYWRYHRKGLATVGEALDRKLLAVRILRALLWLAVNPGYAVTRIAALARRRTKAGERGVLPVSSPVGNLGKGRAESAEIDSNDDMCHQSPRGHG